MSDIRDKAFRHLGYRTRTVKEMRLYLRDKGYSDEEIEPLIQELISLRYLDDYEYAKQYIEYALPTKRGLNRIKMELIMRGVLEEDIENAVMECKESLAIDELSDAISLVRSIASDVSEIDEKMTASIVRKLKRRGYNDGDIMKAIETVRRELNYHDEF